MTGHQSMTVILAVCVTVVFVSFATLQGQQNSAPDPARVAVVDVERVFNSLAETRAAEAELQEQLQELQQEQQNRRTEIQDLEEDYNLLNPDSDAGRQTREQLEQKLIEFEVWQQVNSRKVESELALRHGAIYRSMMSAIERIAEQQGYDMVVFKEQTPEFRGAEDQQQVAQRIQQRKLLYSADHLDISDRVLQRMNNEFQAN